MASAISGSTAASSRSRKSCPIAACISSLIIDMGAFSGSGSYSIIYGSNDDAGASDLDGGGARCRHDRVVGDTVLLPRQLQYALPDQGHVGGGVPRLQNSVLELRRRRRPAARRQSEHAYVLPGQHPLSVAAAARRVQSALLAAHHRRVLADARAEPFLVRRMDVRRERDRR